MNWKVPALAGLLLGAASVAQAADFYMLDYDDQNMTVSLLDPSTIVDGADNHRSFHLAIVGTKNWHAESIIDADCSAERWHMLSTTFYNEDGSVEPDTQNQDWDTFDAGTIGAYMHDAVCNWPNQKPPDDELYQASDFMTAIKEISDKLTNLPPGTSTPDTAPGTNN